MQSLHGAELMKYVEENMIDGSAGYIVFRNYPSTVPYDFAKHRHPPVIEIASQALTYSDKTITLLDILSSHKRIGLSVSSTDTTLLTITIVSSYKADYLTKCLNSLEIIYMNASPYMKRVLQLCIFCDPYQEIIDIAKSVSWIRTSVIVNDEFRTVHENTLSALDYVYDFLKSPFNLTLPYESTFHPRMLHLFEHLFRAFRDQLSKVFAYHFFAFVQPLERFASNRIAHQLEIRHGAGFNQYGWAMTGENWRLYRMEWYENHNKGFDTISKANNLRSVYVNHPYVYPYGTFDDGGDAYYEIVQPRFFYGNYLLPTNIFPFSSLFKPDHAFGVIVPFRDLSYTYTTSVPSILVVTDPLRTYTSELNTRNVGYVDMEIEGYQKLLQNWENNLNVEGVFLDNYTQQSLDISLNLLLIPGNIQIPSDVSKNIIHVNNIHYEAWTTYTRGPSSSKPPKTRAICVFSCPENMDICANSVKAYEYGFGWCYFTTQSSQSITTSEPYPGLIDSIKTVIDNVESQFSNMLNPTFL